MFLMDMNIDISRSCAVHLFVYLFIERLREREVFIRMKTECFMAGIPWDGTGKLEVRKAGKVNKVENNQNTSVSNAFVTSLGSSRSGLNQQLLIEHYKN